MSLNKTVEPDLYDILHNYEDGGGVLNGMFKTRNVVEGLVAGVSAAFLVVKFLSVSIGIKALVATFVGLPLFVLGVLGIGNEPVTSFLFYMFRFTKSKRRLIYKRGCISNGSNAGKNKNQ